MEGEEEVISVDNEQTDVVTQQQAEAAEVAETEVAETGDGEVTPPQGSDEVIPKRLFLQRLGKESAKRREDQANWDRERAEYRALIERLQRNPEQQGNGDGRQQVVNPQDVRQIASQQASQMVFARDTQDVKNAGLAQFGNGFLETLTALGSVDAVRDDVVADLMAVDKSNAHKILAELAKDLEMAATLSEMDPRSRIAMFTRISDKMTAKPAPKPAAKPISKAPPPKPAMDAMSGAPEGAELADELDDTSWSKNFDRLFMGRKTA